MASQPPHRGGDGPIGRRRAGEAPGEHGFDRGELGCDRRRLADPVRERIRAGTPEVPKRGVAVDQLAGRRPQERARRARAQADAGHDRARAERYHDGPRRGPRHRPRRRSDPDDVGAAVGQHAMVMKHRALTDRLRPDAQHVACQRGRWRPLAISGARQLRSGAAGFTRHPVVAPLTPGVHGCQLDGGSPGPGLRPRAGRGRRAFGRRLRPRAKRGPRRCAPRRCPRSPGGRSESRPPGCSTSPRRGPHSPGSRARRTARRRGPG